MLEVNPFKRITIEDILKHKWLDSIDMNTLTLKNVKDFEN